VQAAGAADLPLYECTGGEVPVFSLTDPHDLKVTGTCFVKIGAPSYYGNVNILRNGTLDFDETRGAKDSKTEFWATSIIVENGGTMIARGHPTATPPPTGRTVSMAGL